MCSSGTHRHGKGIVREGRNKEKKTLKNAGGEAKNQGEILKSLKRARTNKSCDSGHGTRRVEAGAKWRDGKTLLLHRYKKEVFAVHRRTCLWIEAIFVWRGWK